MTGIEETIASQLAQARRMVGMSQADLAERLTELGTKTYATTVAKVEQGDRQLKAGELVRWAVALGVRPSVLLCPLDDNADVEVFDGVPASARTLRRFIEGQWPLGLDPTVVGLDTALRYRMSAATFFATASDTEAKARQVPIVVSLRSALTFLENFIADNDDERIDRLMADLEVQVSQARLELARGMHAWQWDEANPVIPEDAPPVPWRPWPVADDQQDGAE